MRIRLLTVLSCCVVLVACGARPGSNLSQAGLAASSGVWGSQKVEWPPRLGRPYPDLELWNHEGRPFRLSRFKGKVLLIEPIGMTCPACNAFAGGRTQGGFRGVVPQGDLDSMAEYVPRFGAGVTLDHPDLVVVSLLLYNMEMRSPVEADAAAWHSHFGIDAPNHHVAYGGEWMVNAASYNLVPGFQLVDRNFILVSDAAGHRSPQDLWRDLIPLLGELLQAGESTKTAMASID